MADQKTVKDVALLVLQLWKNYENERFVHEKKNDPVTSGWYFSKRLTCGTILVYITGIGDPTQDTTDNWERAIDAMSD